MTGDGAAGLRLSVVAALTGCDAPLTADLVEAASPAERQLSQALRGDARSQDIRPLCDLLRLAEGTPAAADLAVGLRQAFLLPDDARASIAHEEPATAFASLYRQLALPGLAEKTRSRALALLDEVAA